MWLVLFMTAAYWAGFELLRDRLQPAPLANPIAAPPQRRWWWMFYLALAFAFLAKGPIGWMPLLAVAATKRFLPDVRLNRRFLFFTGIAFTLSIVALWGIPALARTDGQFLRIGIGLHVVSRSFGVMQGHGAHSIWTYLGMLPFYFVTIFLTFFPWGFSMPWLTQKLWHKRDPLDHYLIGGVAVVFIVFTLVKTKLPHYTLPAFPLLALLLAKALLDFPDAQRFVRRNVLIAASLGLLAAAVTPFVARFFISASLVRQAGRDMTPQMEFGASEYREPSLVWYFRKHTKRFLNDLQEVEIIPFMERPGARFVVVHTERVQLLFPVIPPGWKTYSARGVNISVGKPVDITLLLKPF
jgi:4-amino-4-deoxy-L-arabinose transferase-like glycosyltransferase